jgi:tetratricopeptide (TPR) repeat protein
MRPRERAHEVVAALLSRPLAAQEHLARNCERYWQPAICRALLDRAAALRFTDPVGMARIAGLGEIVADRCGDSAEGTDLRAEARITIAQALIIRGYLRIADTTLLRAARLAATGTGRDALRARVLEVGVQLRLRQGRARLALPLAQEAIAIRERLGDRHGLVSAITQLGIVYDESCDYLSALRQHNRAMELLGQRPSDPRLLLICRHNAIRSVVGLAQPSLALELFEKNRELYQRSADPILILRYRGLRAICIAQFGTAERDAEAEMELRAAAEEAACRALPYEAARGLLDLAELYAKRGRFSLLPELVSELLPLLAAMGIERDTIAARMLQRLAQDHGRTIVTIARLRRLLERKRRTS